MSDLISREALIEEVKRTVDMQDVYLPIIFIDIARNMQTVKAKEWIPCSERLPEEDGEYLTWIRYDGHEFMSIEDFECSGLLAQWNFEGRNDDEVIAWMPLPEPYKGE